MKKRMLWLLLIGNLCMSYSMFTRSFIKTPENVDDFLRGLGIALIFGAFVITVRKKQSLN